MVSLLSPRNTLDGDEQPYWDWQVILKPLPLHFRIFHELSTLHALTATEDMSGQANVL